MLARSLTPVPFRELSPTGSLAMERWKALREDVLTAIVTVGVVAGFLALVG